MVGTQPAATSSSDILSFLQSESTSLAEHQARLTSFLQSKRIPIGSTPRSLRKEEDSSKKGVRIALSTKKNELQCRISLDKAPIGRKCIAPCGCAGTQEWIQFSELNRLRRKEPSQWRVCQTCQQAFDYSMIAQHGGVTGNIVSALLDNVKALRIGAALSFLFFSFIFSLGSLTMRFATSRFFWQLYPRWSKIVHLPLVLKIWGGKVLMQYLTTFYLSIENKALERLAELETQIIEPRLPLIEQD